MYSQKYLSDKIWAGEYLGQFGALGIAQDNYDDSGCGKEETFTYVMTLYSAIGNFVSQLKRFRFWFVPFLLSAIFDFRRIMNEILDKRFYEGSTPERKEAFVAYLLFLDKVSFSSKYKSMAIEIGLEVFLDELTPPPSFLLVVARLSSVSEDLGYSFKKIALSEIRNENTQKEVGWRTICRVARLIGDREMIAKSAPLADSQDVLLKSGVSV